MARNNSLLTQTPGLCPNQDFGCSLQVVPPSVDLPHSSRSGVVPGPHTPLPAGCHAEKQDPFSALMGRTTACGHCGLRNISLFTKQRGRRVSHPVALHTHSRTKAQHSSAATGIRPPNIFIQSKKSCPISYSRLWHFHQHHIHCEKSHSLLIVILELVENTVRFSPVRYNSSVLI